MLRRSALGVGALLVGFHLWLLGNQAWSGQLSEPDVVLQWTAALALAGGLVVLQRRGEPMLFGRKAVAMWVLAALLHGPAVANDHDGFATPSLPEAVATLGQVVTSVSALALALLALTTVRPWRTAGLAGPLRAVMPAFAPALEAASCPGLLPRPPPRS